MGTDAKGEASRLRSLIINMPGNKALRVRSLGPAYFLWN